MTIKAHTIPDTTQAKPAASAASAAASAAGTADLQARSVHVGYDEQRIIEGLDFDLPAHSFTVIIGPNACGKSTLLKALARLLKPSVGGVLLDGTDIFTLKTKDVAKRLGLLPQTSLAPEGIRVADLVARGRFPHQGMFDRWSEADERAVSAAMAATRVDALSSRFVDELSGGQRQRVWVAMALAQEAPVLLLDEPTTFLDISHQYELLELFRRLRGAGRTLVAVLHDLNQAARFATHLVIMRDGEIVAQGEPGEVLTAELVEDIFSLSCRIIDDPETGTPLVIPREGVWAE
ncbi:ABC transporter ATP-binding protein [Pseudoclavibacter helvolus]|uniref:Iron complex transport system ATP-binding protein n=1 Tax=Pseudoclavibacter helvolus TaxID=255205 RepID=A0A7W4UR75_9MICO|nr:ABC transporter ATP-binding protein [Pseudoclavibacter helvolus]MBB2959096.1 iron complex transport system ATP-binding protein [Pseudoclavibacter helvolus]